MSNDDWAGDQVFKVRIWNDGNQSSSDRPRWRGRIEHLDSERVEAFDGLDGLLRILAGWLEPGDG